MDAQEGGRHQHVAPLPETLFPFIWSFLRPFKIGAVVYILLALVVGLWGPLNSLLLSQVVNLLPTLPKGDVSPLVWLISLIVLNLLLIDIVAWRSVVYLQRRFVPVTVCRMTERLMTHLLGQTEAFFHDHLSGALSKHITTLTNDIEVILMSVASNLFRGTSVMLASLIFAYVAHPVFCVTLSVWFVLFAGISFKLSQRLIVSADAQASAEATVSGEVVDTLSNHSNVRLFSRLSHEKERLRTSLRTQQTTQQRTYFDVIIVQTVQGLLIALMMAFFGYFLASLYARDLVNTGDFVLIFGLAMETAYIMWICMHEVEKLNKARGRCQRSLDTLIRPVVVQDKPDARPLMAKTGQIQFQNVTFHYKKGMSLFQNQSVTIASGQKVGLVGYSGGGKSTFMRLLLRLYDISDGAILVDGQDIRNVTQASLRHAMTMIPQEPVLFQRSLGDNICYGNLRATEAEIIAAAKKAHAHDFIMHLPQGYGTLVGERGVKLSGGQRQRIAIARAFLKNAPILLLDEATSQLDSVTETLIQESLATLQQGKTTLVIAHRLSTLLQMERILVFDKGNIVEDGTHDTLRKAGGLYQTLWEAQVGGFLGDQANNRAR